MSAPVTLGTLRLRARQRSNIENQFGFITDTELTAELNSEIRYVYDILVEMGGQEFYRAAHNFNTTASTDTYDLPPQFYRLTSVDVSLTGTVASGQNVITCKPYMEDERNTFKWYPGWQLDRPIYYRLRGNTINFIPSPNGIYNIQINYYPTFFGLVNPDDTFDGINGWEDLAIWKTVANIKAKGDEDPSFAMQRAAEIEQRIRALAATRDAQHPERVHDVFGMGQGYWGV
jgi:hypothetical protein